MVLLLFFIIFNVGKSTFSQNLPDKWKSFTQDLLGTRQKVCSAVKKALQDGYNVFIDRTNLSLIQRSLMFDCILSESMCENKSSSIEEKIQDDVSSIQLGSVSVYCLYFTSSIEECKSRVLIRKNHPNLGEQTNIV